MSAPSFTPGQIHLQYADPAALAALDAVQRTYGDNRTATPAAIAAKAVAYTELLATHRRNPSSVYAICNAVQSMAACMPDGMWNPHLWKALVQVVEDNTTSEYIAASDAAAVAASSMAYLINAAYGSCPLTLKDMQPVLAAVQNVKTDFRTGHALCQYVMARYFEGQSLLHPEDATKVPAELQRARRGKRLLRLGKAFYGVPRAKSGYYYPILVALDGANDVLCNSGCQYGPPSKLVTHWLQEPSDARHSIAMPTLFDALGHLRTKQRLQPKKRAKVDRAIIEAGRQLRQHDYELYKKLEKYIPRGLRKSVNAWKYTPAG